MHVNVEDRRSTDAQILPRKVAERLAQGIVDLRRRLGRPRGASYVREFDVDAADFPAVVSVATKCEIRSARAA
eukprot:5646285-Pyramimonas_sp.AAC.1